MTYTQLPADAWEKLAVNAGVLLTAFDPDTGTAEQSAILGATTGGVTVRCKPQYADLGDEIDNCPPHMLQLRQLTGWECSLSGTMVTADGTALARLLGAADASGEKTVPRAGLEDTDYHDLWYVCDYGAGGFIAVKLLNALSEDGFTLQTADAGRGKMAFSFTGHGTLEDPERIPMEFYIHEA